MRKTVIQLVAAIAVGYSALLLFFTGCSKAPEAPPKEVTIQADDKMRYDLTAFDASPGQKISVTIKNIGTTPKFSMGHNFVLLDRTINHRQRAVGVSRQGLDGSVARLRSAGREGSARPF